MIIFKSKRVNETSRDQIEDSLLLFTLLGNNYALFSSSVVQILQTLTITPVANSLPYFMGSTTFRGEVVPVIDLQSFFYGGQLVLTTKRSEMQSNYIALIYEGKNIIFRVETVLGSMDKPEESQVTNLVNFANPEENTYFIKAFISPNAQLIVLIDNVQIIERIISELEQSQTQFIAENQALLIPMEIPEASDKHNIALHQKLSVSVPSTTDRDVRRKAVGTKIAQKTATLVTVKNYDILIPNNRIVEIFNVQNIAEVPNAPKAVVGTINFRGKVISVLDLAEILVPTSTDIKEVMEDLQEDVQAIILEVADQQIAIIVDELREIVEMTETDLCLTVGSTSEESLSYYFQGVMLDRTGHIILVLNVNFLFQAISNLSVIDNKIQVIFFTHPTKEDVLKKGAIEQGSLGENALVLITLLENIYALESSSVIEILQSLTITPVANSVPYFMGSTIFRGEVVPVIDLHSFFYNGHTLNNEIKPKDHCSYIALEYLGKIIIFQVDSILGSINMPDESQITNIINSTITEEPSFYPDAFLYNDQIIVQLNHQEILNRVVYELELVQNQFVAENQIFLAPIEPPEASEDFNIHLRQNITTERPLMEINPTEVVSSFKDVRPKGTLVSICNLDILVPNNYICEIFNITKITKVPNAPKAIIGSTNYRGNVIPVLNLAEVLTPNSTSASQPSNEVLVLENEDQYIALFTDKIQSIIEIEKTAHRPILKSPDGKIPQHYLQGLMITPTGQIVLILNVEYLFHIATNPIILEQESSQLIYFKNPIQESFRRTHEVKREGLLFEDGGYLFFLNSKHVVQVIEKESFLFKNYPHAAIKGAAIHTTIVPLIDFTIMLKEKNKRSFDSKKSVGILINEPKSNTQYVLLVDSILDKISINECEIFQNYLGISRKTLSPIISGFFSHHGTLGMIVNPDSLYDRIKAVIQNSLSLKDIKEEFAATLLTEEVEFLEDVKAKRKELELLLFYRHEGIRLDLFVFKLQQYALSIDVTFVRKVYSSLEWHNISAKYYPIIGVTIVEDVTLPIIDLTALIFSSQNQAELNQNSFLFLLEIENHLFLVPANTIEGVVTKFKEELIPWEESEIFLEGKETCQFVFSYENFSSSIYIIENEFLKKTISKKDLETLLKEIKNEIKEKD